MDVEEQEGQILVGVTIDSLSDWTRVPLCIGGESTVETEIF